MSRNERILSALGIAENARCDENFRLVSILRHRGSELIGNDAESIEVSQWLPVASTLSLDDLPSINDYLLLSSYLVGSRVTIADIIIADATLQLQNFDAYAYPGILRWINHITSLFPLLSSYKQLIRPTIIPDFSSFTPGHHSKAVKVVSDKDKKSTVGSVEPASAEAKAKKVKVKPDQEAEKKTAVDLEAASDTDLDPSKLDIRVGYIVNCWNHTESEKLLCEEIDVGEDKPRNIASGLRAHYSADEMKGRKVLVLANLKERPMAGFKSQGMVLCACNDDHSAIKLLEPPANSKPGDRVTFPGFDGEPATPAQVVKKKILEKLGPQLRTDASGAAHWGTVPFIIGDNII